MQDTSCEFVDTKGDRGAITLKDGSLYAELPDRNYSNRINNFIKINEKHKSILCDF